MEKRDQKNPVEYRNAFGLHAKRRHAVKFKDRRQERGGARNKQRDFIENKDG